MTQTHRIVSLDIESAVHFAIQAYQNKECVEQVVPDTTEETVVPTAEVRRLSNPSIKSDT